MTLNQLIFDLFDKNSLNSTELQAIANIIFQQQKMKLTKVLLLAFLVTVIFTQSLGISVGGASPSSPKGLISVPFSALDSLHRYIHDLIVLQDSSVKTWKLTDIKEKENKVLGTKIFKYTYSLINSQDNVIMESKTFAIELAVKISLESGMKASPPPPPLAPTPPPAKTNNAKTVVGGFTQGDTNALTKIQQDAFNFIIKNVPKLNTWAFTNVKSKIVAGEINCFTFSDFVGGSTEEYCVWSKIWERFMELTLPNGQKITQIAQQPAVPQVATPANPPNLSQPSSNLPASNPPASNPPSSSPPSTGSPGAFTPSNPNSLTPTEQAARMFVVEKVPKLTTWWLVGVKSKIVAGEETCFLYRNPISGQSNEYCVWSQPWNNNFMQLTLPDGTKIKKGGK